MRIPKQNILIILIVVSLAGALSSHAQEVQPMPNADEICQTGPDAFVYHMEQGGLMRGLDNPEQAFLEYECALRLQPNSGLAYRGRARTYLDRGMLELALADYDVALDYLPDDPITLNNRGLALARMGLYIQAADYYTRALIIKPDYSLAYINRSLVYRDLGRIEDAASDLQAAMQLSHTPIHIPYFHMAELWWGENRLTEALYWYERAVAMNPNFSHGWKMLGDLHYERGDYAQAGSHYERYLYLENRADTTVLLRVEQARITEWVLRYLPSIIILLIAACWLIIWLRRWRQNQIAHAALLPIETHTSAGQLPDQTPPAQAGRRRWQVWLLTLPLIAALALGIRQLFSLERR